MRHAVAGIGTMLRTQHNAWIHSLATVLVVATGWSLQLSRMEWALTVVAITAVWAAEAINTAFELLCDVASPDFHPMVKQSKDVAAGAVLLSAIGAVVIAVLVFGPHFVS